MFRIYNAETECEIGRVCIASKNWHQDKPKRTIGFLLFLLPIISYAIAWWAIMYIPALYNAIVLALINELMFIPIIISSAGLVMLLLQYEDIRIVKRNNGEQFLFTDSGFAYRYIDNDKLYTYSIHYKNVNWMMYNDEKKHLVVNCKYLYQKQGENNGIYPNGYPDIAVVTNNMDEGVVVIPMCFVGNENILSMLLRKTGRQIHRKNSTI